MTCQSCLAFLKRSTKYHNKMHCLHITSYSFANNFDKYMLKHEFINFCKFNLKFQKNLMLDPYAPRVNPNTEERKLKYLSLNNCKLKFSGS